MNGVIEQFQNLPVGALVAIALLAVLQLSLQAYCLIDLLRRPPEGLKLGNKWIWGGAIVLGQFYGPLLYLALARKPLPVPENGEPRWGVGGEEAPHGVSDKAERAADVLYGKDKG